MPSLPEKALGIVNFTALTVIFGYMPARVFVIPPKTIKLIDTENTQFRVNHQEGPLRDSVEIDIYERNGDQFKIAATMHFQSLRKFNVITNPLDCGTTMHGTGNKYLFQTKSSFVLNFCEWIFECVDGRAVRIHAIFFVSCESHHHLTSSSFSLVF